MTDLTVKRDLINKDYYNGPGLTVKELKAILEKMPDDNLIIVLGPDCEALNVTNVNTYWHGAVTIQPTD